MGNYKFRLADMMPNAWFYKLRDMNRKPAPSQKIAKKTKTKKNSSSSSYSSSPSTTTTTTVYSKHQNHPFSPRKSYYFTRDCPSLQKTVPDELARKSSAKPRPRRRRRSSAAKHSPEFSPENLSSEENDVVIDVDKASLKKKPEPELDDSAFAKLELAPIITKSAPSSKKISAGVNSTGIRLRISHSPRIVPKKAARKAAPEKSRRLRSLSDSFAVVKSSANPQKDFKDSMMEMIEEHNIRASKDLEDLLACYLSLNSDEYHGTIIKVFKQIWFDLADLS